MNREQMLDILAGIATDKNERADLRIKAIEAYARLAAATVGDLPNVVIYDGDVKYPEAYPGQIYDE